MAELSAEQGKVVEVAFDGDDLTSDSGLLLLAGVDRRLGLSPRLARVAGDSRQQNRVRHSITEMFRTRIGAIAAGYPDCNDLNRLRGDKALRLFSAQRLAGGKSPRAAGPNTVLAGQSTLCRFENGMSRSQVYRLAMELARVTIEQLPLGTQHVVVEFDSTDSTAPMIPAMASRSLKASTPITGITASCRFMPLLCHLAVSDKNGHLRRWQLPVLLRPGRVHGTVGVRAVLKRVVALLRERFPQVRIIVRADSGFGTNEVMCACEKLRVDYVLGLPQNPALHHGSRRLQMDTCLRYSREREHWRLLANRTFRPKMRPKMRRTSKQAIGEEATREHIQERPVPLDPVECVEYGSIYHEAGSWPKVRRVVVKSAITHSLSGEATLNPRFVVTSLAPIHANAAGKLWKASEVYHFYCQRGDQENRIKEWKLDLEGGRTSCHRFLANQFRLLLHGAALLLLNVLQSRLDPKRTLGRATIGTLRTTLLKVAAKITISCRRIRIQMPSAFPYQEAWQRLHQAFCT